MAFLAREFELRRPIKVLLEGGYLGGRTGCRTVQQARDVIAELRSVQRWLALAGVEGFEGVISRDNPSEAVAQVGQYLAFLKELVAELKPEDFSGVDEVIFLLAVLPISISWRRLFAHWIFFCEADSFAERLLSHARFWHVP